MQKWMQVAHELAEQFDEFEQTIEWDRRDMSYFSGDVSNQAFSNRRVAQILVRLNLPKNDLQALIEDKVRTASMKIRKTLTVDDRVFLWMQVPALRDVIKFDELPELAQSYIYVRDEALFEERYDPNTSSARLNKNILKEIEDHKVLGVFFKKIDDENLAALMHKYPNDVSCALRTYRLHKKSALKPRLAKLFDCSKVRNQSHLRGFIHSFPWVMANQTLDTMEASSINRDTWARILAEMKVKDRQYFPVGTGPWCRRGIFVKHLKGKNSNAYKDFETGLPVDNTDQDVVEYTHDNDIPTIDTLDSA